MSRNWLTDTDVFGEGKELIAYMGTLKTEFQLFRK